MDGEALLAVPDDGPFGTAQLASTPSISSRGRSGVGAPRACARRTGGLPGRGGRPPKGSGVRSGSRFLRYSSRAL